MRLTAAIRKAIGWVMVIAGLGLAYVSQGLVRLGAHMMDREDVLEEFDAAH